MSIFGTHLIAKKSGCAIPKIGFGAWSIGGRQRDESYDRSRDRLDLRALDRALECGIVHFDTAEKYANGHAECLLGETLERVPRHQIFVTSKVDALNMRPDQLRRACEQSLTRLGTGYLDLYLLHSATDEVSVLDLVLAMDGLVEAGLVRHIGVSNFAPGRLLEAHRLSAYGMSCNQVHYSLIQRGPERTGLLDLCQREGIPLIAYRGIERGRMIEHPPEALTSLARKYNKTPTQIALAWLTSQQQVGTLIFSKNPEHLDENLGAFDFELEAEEVELLRREFPGQETVSPVSELR